MEKYNFRICAALPGHEPVEIMRSNRSYHPSDLRRWTGSMDAAWQFWIEGRMPDNRCITPRIKISPVNAAVARAFHLNHEMKKEAGIV